jgi:sodium transport system permease protein
VRSAIFTVFRKEFLENLRDRRTILTGLLIGPLMGPLLISVLLTVMVQRGAVQDEVTLDLAVSHTERAPNLVRFLRERGVKVEAVTYDDAAARAAVRDDRHAAVLMITEEYAQRFETALPAPLLLYADASDAENQRDAQRAKRVIAQFSSAMVQLRMMARGVDPLVLAPISVQDVDVSTPAGRSVLALGAVSYIVLLSMLMGGLYLAIDATAGERERGSLEPLLTVPVHRPNLIYGKILATCAYMSLTLVLTVTAFAITLRFVGLERFGMSVNFGPLTALQIGLCCLPLVPLGAALMTTVAAFTRSYREAQTYLGLVLMVPTLPLVFAAMLGLRPTAWLMSIPSLSQHFLITSLLRDEPISAAYLTISVVVTLALGLILALLAGRLYSREALLG